MHFLFQIWQEFWAVLLEAAPFVLLGFALAGVFKAFVPRDLARRRLGGEGAWPVIEAALLGVPLPLCSCGVIPAAVELRRAGASKGATTSFLVSTPETGIDSILVNYAMLDPLMTVLRPLAALCTGALAGLAVNRFDSEAGSAKSVPGAWDLCQSQAGHAPPFPLGAPASTPVRVPAPREFPRPKPDTPPGRSPQSEKGDRPDKDRDHQEYASTRACSVSCSCAAEPAQEPKGFFARLVAGQVYAFGEMLPDIGTWLLGGILLAAVLGAALPPDGFKALPGGELGAMLAMLVLGLPIYVCASASTPVAAAMVLHGLSPGAALVFMLAGPATNAASVVILWRLFGPKSTLVYLFCVALGALAFGLLADAAYWSLGLDATGWLALDVKESPGLLSWASALALAALSLGPLLGRLRKPPRRKSRRS